MNRSLSMLALSAVMLAPLVWILATADLSDDKALMTATGAIVASGFLLVIAWRMHLKGKLLPYRCKTCSAAMQSVAPGELRPPSGQTSTDIKWRCTRCGRLE